MHEKLRWYKYLFIYVITQSSLLYICRIAKTNFYINIFLRLFHHSKKLKHSRRLGKHVTHIKSIVCAVLVAMFKKKMQKEDSTARSREVAQPSTDVARDCLISRFGVELDVSSRVWPLQKNSMTWILICMFCKLTILCNFVKNIYIIYYIFENNYVQYIYLCL